MPRWFDTVRDLTTRLVRWPSITNSAGERDFAGHLRDLLAQTPYFQANPDHLVLHRTDDDPFERYNLYALVRGDGPRTVVMSGHFDVVSIDNYGQLAEWACDPDELLPRMVADLAAGTSEAPANDRLALRDLQSGDFLPGRGALDMKSGIAAGLAVLLRAAEQPDRQGNLLLVATPDEEEASHGARAAALQLAELARQWGLDLLAGINLDAASDHGDGSAGQVAFLGTVGKFLPAVYLVGRDTHAGYPFDGINANLLAAAVTARIECNADLCDEAEGEVAPPPVSLKQVDLKGYYDVTTPAAAWCYFNYLTHGRPAGAVLALFVAEVKAALAEVIARQAEQARRYAERAQPAAVAPLQAWQPLVLTFAELRERVAARIGGDALATLVRGISGEPGLDAPTLSRMLIEALWRQSGMVGPAAVVAFGSLHYPHSLVVGDGGQTRAARLLAIVREQTAALSRERATPITVRRFFTGISDMSFFGSAMESADQAVIAENTPLGASRLRFDYGAVRALAMPVVNIGPWGRDYHQRLERVHMPYSFEVLPELLWRTAWALLND